MAILLPKYKFVFIHIPKNGGSSIWNSLKLSGEGINITPDYAHRTIKEVEKKYNVVADLYIAQVRDPYDRFYSMYHYLCEYTQKRIDGKLPLKRQPISYWSDLINLLCKIRFDGFVEMLLKKNDVRDFLFRFPLERGCFLRQVDYLNSSSQKKIFKLETGEIWQFFKHLNPKIKESHTKKTKYKSIQYNKHLRKIVYDYFKEDFLSFNYQP